MAFNAPDIFYGCKDPRDWRFGKSRLFSPAASLFLILFMPLPGHGPTVFMYRVRVDHWRNGSWLLIPEIALTRLSFGAGSPQAADHVLDRQSFRQS
jgi:hypothetical protein